ncbi:MAG TPA: LLM class flavin-dependent oxidoreductase [Candidatus Acidoferrales bacterium]|nr:LLM class flavin-dependent oxidoreductase [Candidatus Acidoferrales bacterium]
MERTGFALGYGRFTDVREIARVMRQAEERGYEMAFFSETIELMRDSVTALAAIGLATERLVLGATQIVGLRSAVCMAQTLATLDELTDGRMTLAPGACTRSHARVHGIEFREPPPLLLKEYVEVMRLLLRGEKVSYNGKFINLEGVGLGWKPKRARIPIYLPATSTAGLRLAGQIADGVVLNAVCSPEYTANALKIIAQAAAEAGRDLADFEVAQIINCSVEDDHKSALDAVRWEVATKFDPVQIPFIAGPKMRVGEPYIRKEDLERFRDAYAQGGMDALIKTVPDSYVEGMTASGTPEEVKRRVRLYRAAGVKIPLLRPATLNQTGRLLDLFAKS